MQQQNFSLQCSTIQLVIAYIIAIQQTMNTSQQNQAENTYYGLLPEAKPLRKRLPPEMTSVFQFNQQEPQLTYPENSEPQPLQNIHTIGKDHQFLHEIGESMKKLFQNPVYIMHRRILCEENDQFGMCGIAMSENDKIDAQKAYFCEDSELLFNSRFECGNLAMAASANQPKSYNLLIHKDLNSKENSSTQWFYFSVKNGKSLGAYSFNIVNYMKPYSAFQSGGMKPCIYSVKSKASWGRGGRNIHYRKNSLVRQEGKHFFSMGFTYDFNEKDDQVFFAYCYPYTQTKLLIFLDRMEKKHPSLVHRKAITHTLGGNSLEMISITNQNTRDKKVIFISARVHPGETVSSFVCEGFIEFLLGNSQQANKMRHQYIIRIFPMLNPDGVVNGSYRASLSGDDLNRQWHSPSRIKHPEIFYVKKMISETPYDKLLYVDMHGHSKKKSCFMYGCYDRASPYMSREFPYILSKKCASFNYYNCNFATPKHKQGTSRVAIWKEFKLLNSYTFETSFCSATRSKFHFTMKDYRVIGRQLCEVISLYFCKRFERQETDVKNILGQFYNNQDLMEVGEIDSDGSSTDQDKPQEQAALDSSESGQKHLSPQGNHQIFQQKNSTNYNQTDTKKRWFSFHKQLQKTGKEDAPDPIMKNRHFGDRLKIHHLQLETQTRSSFEIKTKRHVVNSDSDMRLENVVPHIRQSSNQLFDLFNPTVAFKPNSTRHLERTPDYSAILFPKVMKNQYKKYQRYRKEELDLKSIPISIQKKRSISNPSNPTNPNQIDTNIQMKSNSISAKLSSYGNQEISLLERIMGKDISSIGGDNGCKIRHGRPNRNIAFNSVNNGYMQKYISNSRNQKS